MKLFKKNTKGSALTTVIGGVVIVLAVLFLLVKLAGSGYYSDVSDDTSSATETRIMPSGRLVEGDGTEPVDLKKVAGNLALVPPDHPWIRTARDVGTGLGD